MTNTISTVPNKAWEQPLVSIDVVPIFFDHKHQQTRIVLGERLNEPYQGEFALPGVLLQNETTAEAAQRALNTKLSLPNNSTLYLKDIGIMDGKNRDPRGPTLSIIYLAVVTPPATEFFYTDISHLNTALLPFDHNNIILKAIHDAENLFLKDLDFTKAITGATFQSTDIKKIIQDFQQATNSDSVIDIKNLSRFMTQNPLFERVTPQKQKQFTKGRPSSAWIYTK